PTCRPQRVLDRAVFADDGTGEYIRAQRGRRADLPEERRGGRGDGATDVPAGDVAAHVVAGEAEQRHDDERSAQERQHGLAPHEAGPEPERDPPERGREEEGGPAQACGSGGGPPRDG